MSKIWYCPNCGYEVNSRGRCHSCRSRLVASALPELETGDEDDEVGYRLDDWVDRDRGRLIESLNTLEVLHRFEDDELVVAADDEARVDDLIAEIAASPTDDGSADDGAPDGSEPMEDEDQDQVTDALRMLAKAAHRLREDPTDMHADADVAEASAAVFTVDDFYAADPETWAAVGRVTRRLLSALGADEALEDEIRTQAGVLYKLVDPLLEFADADEDEADEADEDEEDEETPAEVVAGDVGATGGAAAGGAATGMVAGDVAPTPSAAGNGPDGAGAATGGLIAAAAAEDGTPDASGVRGESEIEESEAALDDDVDGEQDDSESETVYELPEWLPEQRAQLGVLMDDAEIEYQWEGDDLVVPADRESEVEALFGEIGGPADDGDDGEDRYRAIEELFAVSDRLTNDPSDEHRAGEVVARIQEVAGPPPLGLDEVAWFRIMTQARVLSDVIQAKRDQSTIAEEARSLRDLLRGIV